MRRNCHAVVLLLAICATATSSALAEEAPLVAAASDVQFALRDIEKSYTVETGETLRLTFGSSGNFARQIRAGAPVELFLAADERYVADLASEGLTRDAGALYGIGRLALVVPKGSPLKPDGTLEDLRAALHDGRLKKFAIPNPLHAPYGERAMEVLKRLGLWGDIESRLVLGENVSQAAQFATSGAADGGIIAYALTLAPEVAERGLFAPIPAEWHTPLRQRMVLMKPAGAGAERFYNYLQGPKARSLLEKWGFTLPADGK